MVSTLPVLQSPAFSFHVSQRRTSPPLTISSSFSSSSSISSFISRHPPLLLLETNCHTMTDLQILHAQIIKTGLSGNPIALSRLLAFFGSRPSCNPAYALRLFSQIPNPTSFSWNTIIRSLSRSSNPSIALLLFLDMLCSSIVPQNLTFPSLFISCARMGSPEIGAQVHALAAKLGFSDDMYISNSMIFMYGSAGDLGSASILFNRRLLSGFDSVACNSMIMALVRNGRLSEARRLFDEMPHRTISSWNTMMSGYLRNGLLNEVISMFKEMKLAALRPNASSIVTLLGACAGLGALELGQWAHSVIINNNIEMNPVILNALILMYCSCGCLEKALETFESARHSNKRALSPWNSMIKGFAVHGLGSQAVELFSRMKLVLGLKPDAITYVAVLSACAHSGLVEEAKEIFVNMEEEPGVEHYGCMVDVLARSGRLYEAEEMIQKMPINPDVAIWGALLSGSRSYGDLEMAERAAKEVLALDPGDAGGYLLLANTLAASGKFGDAVNARAAMKEKRTEQTPGCSMIEVDGMLHEFLVT